MFVVGKTTLPKCIAAAGEMATGVAAAAKVAVTVVAVVDLRARGRHAVWNVADVTHLLLGGRVQGGRVCKCVFVYVHVACAWPVVCVYV